MKVFYVLTEGTEDTVAITRKLEVAEMIQGMMDEATVIRETTMN